MCRVRRFVSEAVDLTQIVDHLLVHAVEIRYLARVVIRTATLLREQIKRTTRILNERGRAPLPDLFFFQSEGGTS